VRSKEATDPDPDPDPLFYPACCLSLVVFMCFSSKIVILIRSFYFFKNFSFTCLVVAGCWSGWRLSVAFLPCVALWLTLADTGRLAARSLRVSAPAI
jgi:hypothetical protein